MKKQKLTLTFLIALSIITLLFTGLPTRSRKISNFKSLPTFKITPYIDNQGNIVADLKGLKRNEVPFVNIHTANDLFFIGNKYASSVDFGALEELSEIKPTFRGQLAEVKVPSRNIRQPSEIFKILTARKAENEIVALLGENQLLVPIKKIKFKNGKQNFNYSQFDVAISDTFIFTKIANCFQTLNPGNELFSTCRDYVSKSPYSIDYNPETYQLKFKPNYIESLTKLKTYNISLSVSYGRIAGLQYSNKGKVPTVKKSEAKILASFELNPALFSNSFANSERVVRAASSNLATSPDYQAAKCGGDEGRERIAYKSDRDIKQSVGGTLCRPRSNGKWSSTDFNNAEEQYQQGVDRVYAKCAQIIKNANSIPVPNYVGKCPGCPNGGSGCQNPEGDGFYNLMQTGSNYEVKQFETSRDDWNICYIFQCEVPHVTDFPVRWTCTDCEDNSSNSVNSSSRSSDVSTTGSNSSSNISSSSEGTGVSLSSKSAGNSSSTASQQNSSSSVTSTPNSSTSSAINSPDYQAATCGGDEGRERIAYSASEAIKEYVGGTICMPRIEPNWTSEEIDSAKERFETSLDYIYSECQKLIKSKNKIAVPEHVGKCPGCAKGSQGCVNPDGTNEYRLMQTSDNYKVVGHLVSSDHWNTCFKYTCEVPKKTEFPVRWSCTACADNSSNCSESNSSEKSDSSNSSDGHKSSQSAASKESFSS